MKMTIRKECFETNSSSMHSIVVTKNKGKYSAKDIEYRLWDGIMNIRMDDNDFGRAPFRMLHDVVDKIKYVIASYIGVYRATKEERKEFLDNLTDIVKSVYPEFKGFGFNNELLFYNDNGDRVPDIHVFLDDRTGKYYMEHDDGTKTEVSVEYNEDVYGDVDHQSSGLLPAFPYTATI